jgi:hypothetical protein
MNQESNNFFYVFIFLGVFFRLVFLEDMEWKFDQLEMYKFIKEFHLEDHFRWIGMNSGVNIPNFGASVWVFYLMGFFTLNPVWLSAQVAMLNIAAIFIFIYITFKYIAQKEKHIWYYALALMSVSMIAVSFSRHLWAQNILPFFTALLFWLYIKRGTHWFIDSLFGFILVLIGQIHMSGIFLAFSYVIMTLLVFKSRKINLIAIFSGGILSFLPSIPLLIHVFANPSSPSNKKIFSFFELKFLWYTMIQGAGIDIFYHLGKSSLSFIKYPTFCGIDTYFTGIIYFLMIVSIISGVYFLFKSWRWNGFNQFLTLIQSNYTTQFCCISMLTLILITLTGANLFGHYLIVTFPFVFLYASYIIFKVPYFRIQVLFLILNTLTTLLFLLFIHTNQGCNDCEYGKTYKYKISKNL